MSAVLNGLVGSRLLIFGLLPGTTEQEVRTLLGRCAEARVRVVVMPGDGHDVMGVVHLPLDGGLAQRLADRVNHRRLHGRSLQCWVPVMAWH
jgi:hypothetical protein